MNMPPLEPWRDYHPLESPLYKISWAHKHLEAIDRYIDLYNSLNPHTVVSELNADKTFYECSLVALFPPFADFGIAIGEFAYELRSSLDQIIFALSDFSGLNDWELEKAERSTSFPLLKKRNDAYIKGQLNRVPAAILDNVWKIVDGVQPYQSGDRAEFTLLAVLEEMNVRDKHRILKPTGIRLVFDPKIDARIITMTGHGKDGDIVARVPADLDPSVHLYPYLSTEIKVEIPRPAGGIVLNNLGRIYNRVRHEVMPQFLTFFDPLPDKAPFGTGPLP